ncbi:hypothetical protein R1flu_021644 [Riccia fluitans]|uniref:Uncharacterized protein n=1 Tax=Riccia fluitans TaxID=41844 RepID=A0ABD1ZRS4_9MARC
MKRTGGNGFERLNGKTTATGRGWTETAAVTNRNGWMRERVKQRRRCNTRKETGGDSVRAKLENTRTEYLRGAEVTCPHELKQKPGRCSIERARNERCRTFMGVPSVARRS